MFRENHRHEQGNFFNTVGQLPRGVKKMMDKSHYQDYICLKLKTLDSVDLYAGWVKGNQKYLKR